MDPSLCLRLSVQAVLRPFRWTAVAVLAGAFPCHGGAAAVPDFHADVAPILRDYCAGCHSGKEKEGDLNLETFAALKTGGESGSPLPQEAGAQSLMDKVIHGKKPAMPPKKEPQPTAADLAVLESWLKAGAPGPKAQDVSILSLVTVPDLPLKKNASPAIITSALSRDGKKIAVARYRVVEVLDADSKEVRQRFEGFPSKITALAFSPDGNRLAAATGDSGVRGTISLHHLDGSEGPKEFELQHRDLIYSVSWSPDGKTLASGGYDWKVVLWDAATGRLRRTLTGHNGAVFSVAFHPDGRLLASASADQTVKVWRLQDGERLDTLKEPQGEQFSVTFTPDGKQIVAAGADRRIRIWALKSLERAEINPMLESRFAHEAPVTGLVVAPTGDRVLSVAVDRSLKVWTLPKLELVEILPPQPQGVTSIQGDPTGNAFWLSRVDGAVVKLDFPKREGRVAAVSDHGGPAGTDLGEAVPPAARGRIEEQEPNDGVTDAQKVMFPAEMHGKIGASGDVDTYRFSSKKGQKWSFEVFAEREKSMLDSRLEVLDGQGQRIERVLLQATRSSWLTFRGKDAKTSDDFRVQNYAEMEINEFLYCNGEVVKLWMYPRGPDSGFMVYPGIGTRHTYFETTPLSHPLGETVYTVKALPPGSQPPPSGLPLIPVYWENDDDPRREAGHDSVLLFEAPADGEYLLRVGDTRGFGGEPFGYRVVARAAQPDFVVKLSMGDKLKVSPGSGSEFQVEARRIDGFEGEIEVVLENLPPGFSTTGSVVIEAGQTFASGAVYASADAPAPSKEAVQAVQLVAQGKVQGRAIAHKMNAFSELSLRGAPKLTARVLSAGRETGPAEELLEIVLKPGETVTARMCVNRHDFKERVEFGKEDAGRNLPHGVYVDNLGLNGLLIPEEATEREFFLTAAKWVQEGTRTIFFRAKGDGGQATPPIRLRVVRP